MVNINTVTVLDLSLYICMHFVMQLGLQDKRFLELVFLGKEEAGPGKEQGGGVQVRPDFAICLPEISVFRALRSS